MAVEFPAMPAHYRVDLVDGFPEIRVTRESVVLSDGETTVTIPGRWIDKFSRNVVPGDDATVNRFGLVFHAGRISVSDDILHEVRVNAYTR